MDVCFSFNAAQFMRRQNSGNKSLILTVHISCKIVKIQTCEQMCTVQSSTVHIHNSCCNIYNTNMAKCCLNRMCQSIYISKTTVNNKNFGVNYS
jgi:hypothetical protein